MVVGQNQRILSSHVLHLDLITASHVRPNWYASLPRPRPALIVAIENDASSSSRTPKAISNFAKRPTDTTRQGTQKLKFAPTLPPRRKKELVLFYYRVVSLSNHPLEK